MSGNEFYKSLITLTRPLPTATGRLLHIKLLLQSTAVFSPVQQQGNRIVELEPDLAGIPP